MARGISLKPLDRRVLAVKKALGKIKKQRAKTALQRRILDLHIRQLDTVHQTILAICSPRTPKYWV